MAKETEASLSSTAHADTGERVLRWLHERKRPLIIAVSSVVLIGGATWFVQTARVRKEAFAANELGAARLSIDAGNYQLASSDLGRIVNSYAGTSSGEEATILLARVHLMQSRADLAVSELRTFLDGGPRQQFVAPAAGLLGGALENSAQFGQAADAYRRAADGSAYDLVKAEYLIDLGRAAVLGGDASRAVAAYRELIEMEIDENAKIEARLRLGELGAVPEADGE